MFGEIVLCQFPFSSGNGSNIRPALVLFDLGGDSVICRVTSVLYTGRLDVLLKDWRATGLLKPVSARLERIITAEKTIFLRYLGTLTSQDAEAVRVAWNQYMKL